MKLKIPSFWLITIALVIVKLCIHFLTGSIYELHRDEMLYFAQGGHLSFGYISNSPFVGFLSFIVQQIFGYSQFGIKLFPALAGAASLVVIALFVKELGGKNLTLIIAGVAFMVSGAFLRSNALFQPVSFDEFFWLLSSYLVLKMANRNNPRLWLWIGFVFGLAFLNKYAIVFFAFAILLALLLSEHHKLLFSKALFTSNVDDNMIGFKN
jgi:4-amino-4-deoxy-L-arabinose transferase-like glycosyltransferase